MTDRILNVQQVAEMLGCTTDTVRERTPRHLPGTKFGRDWVYVEGQVVAAVAELADQERRRIEQRDSYDERTRLTEKLYLGPDRRGKPLPQLGGQIRTSE